MKTLLAALVLALVFSTSVYAKKVEISFTTYGSPSGGSEYEVDIGDELCTYRLTACFAASAHTHRDNVLALQAVTDTGVQTIYDSALPGTGNWTRSKCSGTFYVPRGEDWELAWVLEKDNGKKVRIVDAAEQFAGTCPAP